MKPPFPDHFPTGYGPDVEIHTSSLWKVSQNRQFLRFQWPPKIPGYYALGYKTAALLRQSSESQCLAGQTPGACTQSGPPWSSHPDWSQWLLLPAQADSACRPYRGYNPIGPCLTKKGSLHRNKGF